MSTDYTFYAIIGVEFSTDTDMFRSVEREPNCDHQPDPAAKFCPTCGKPVGTRTYTSTSDAYDELRELNNRGLKDGFAMVLDDDRNVCVVGYGRRWDKYDSHQKLNLPPSDDEIKATLREILEPFGVFINEADYGFYTGVEAR